MSKETKEAIIMYNRFSVITHESVLIGMGKCMSISSKLALVTVRYRATWIFNRWLGDWFFEKE